MKKISEMEAGLMQLALPIGLMIVTAYPDYHIIFANAKFCTMLGFEGEKESLLAAYKSAWDCIYREDISRLKEAAERQSEAESYEIAYRVLKKDGTLLWINQYSQHMQDESGKELIFAYYTDITAQKQMEETILKNSEKYESLVNSVPGGVGMYRLDEALTPIFMSDHAYELCGMTKEEYCAATRSSTLDIFHPDDRQGLLDAIQAAYQGKQKFEYTHRVLQKDGSYRWMRVSGQIMERQDGVPLLYTVFTDVHEQIRAEQALRESELRYAAAIKAANINVCEYHYAQDTMTIFSTSPRVNPQSAVIPAYLDSILAQGNMREDSVALFFEMIEKMKKGAERMTADLWVREQGTLEYWCERVIYTNIFDENGVPIKIYCIGRDVTKEKEAEKRYRDELSYREAMQKATMASINVNLTRNEILDYKSNFAELTARMSASKTAQEYFDQVYTELKTVEMQQKCASMFGRDALLRHFANGETTVSLGLTRRIEGRSYWTVMTAHMMKKPENNEIVAFVYSTNITNERTMQNVMNAIVKTDYDFLVVVDALRNTAVRYSKKELGNVYANESENFEEETCAYVRRYICREDVPRVVEELTIKNILKQLDTHETYSIFYAVPNKQGVILRKQLRFSYINRDEKSFLMTRTDITAAVEEQEKKNQELVAAVEMAERANAAKSEFLSRISHEIRTPMNAIMGLAQVALQNLDDQKLVSDCIEKSQYSSHYLLALLGDILDMAKIENGKIALKNEKIYCQRFLDAVNTIIVPQTEQKGIHYVVTEFENRRDCYLGDSVRLQQILINILSNAVKFTPNGGTVRLDIRQLRATAEKAELCFRITDTGIGIGKEFLTNIFKPFSQEHSGATSSYGGSGLGLAISKNLAQLMGGDILVESSLGAGTTFTVYLSLGIPKAFEAEARETNAAQSHTRYNFSGKKFLLVEDHQLNIMVARKLLEAKNAEVIVAENGEIALQTFVAAPEHTYDAILMDIRMPVMDGLQAAREIRALDSAWAKQIPIIAMSANAYEDDIVKSQDAGMNAHLAKPIDLELLCQTLERFSPRKEENVNGYNA